MRPSRAGKAFLDAAGTVGAPSLSPPPRSLRLGEQLLAVTAGTGPLRNASAYVDHCVTQSAGARRSGRHRSRPARLARRRQTSRSTRAGPVRFTLGAARSPCCSSPARPARGRRAPGREHCYEGGCAGSRCARCGCRLLRPFSPAVHAACGSSAGMHGRGLAYLPRRSTGSRAARAGIAPAGLVERRAVTRFARRGAPPGGPGPTAP